jgi:hypothetical protein
VFSASTENVMRRLSPQPLGRMFIWRSIDDVYGEEQELRAAILLSCDERHSRARTGADASNRAIPFDIQSVPFNAISIVSS